jgi:hypothetical protein
MIYFKDILIKHVLPIDFNVKIILGQSNINEISKNSYGGLFLLDKPFKVIPC